MLNEPLKRSAVSPESNVHIPDLFGGDDIIPRGSRYLVIKDLGPKSHNNHGL